VINHQVFLSPAEVIELATRWRLPLNEVWYCPEEVAVEVEKTLHAARWTLKDSQVNEMMSKISQKHDNNGAASDGSSIVQQSFLTHLETQGEELEGFVLMALEVANMNKLTEFVNAYNKEMAPCHDRVLKAALDLGRRCSNNDPQLEKTINNIVNGGVEILLSDQITAPAPEPSVLSISSSILWDNVCRAEGDVGGMFRRLRDSYKHKVGLKAYRYQPIGDSAAVVMNHRAAVSEAPDSDLSVTVESENESTTQEGAIPYFEGKCRKCQQRGHKASDCGKTIAPKKNKPTSITSANGGGGGGGSGANSVLQVQIDVHDDNVFYSWPLHVLSGNCSPLFRGLVVQFDHEATSSQSNHKKSYSNNRHKKQQQQSIDNKQVTASSIGIETKIEMKILGIEKLKCLNYIWRTFGVRNQMTCLLNQGSSAYLKRCKTGFFKNWSIPNEYHSDMLCLFEGWANYVSKLNKSEKEKCFNKQTYLDILEDYLGSGDVLAKRASHIVSGISDKFIDKDKNNGKNNRKNKKIKNDSAAASSSSSSPLSEYYVVVSNLTGQDIASNVLDELGLSESNMITEKPTSFQTNQWFSVNQMPIPWMFDTPPGKKSRQKKKNQGLTPSTEASIPQIALVFGPPPDTVSQQSDTVNPLTASTGSSGGGGGTVWKHLTDQGEGGWVAKNPTIPLFINPHTDFPAFFKTLSEQRATQMKEKQIELEIMKQKKQENLPLVIVVAILALPPGGGKSTFMKLLQTKANALIVSSDVCTQKNKKFDKEIVNSVKNAANSPKHQYIQKITYKDDDHDIMHDERRIRIIGYDKNIPDEKGFEKLLKLMSTCINPEKMNLKIAIIVPQEVNPDECWNRILKRDDSYLLTPALKPENEVHKIFNNFYSMTSSFLIKAQGLVSNQTCITECFFNQMNDNNDDKNDDDDDGMTKCSKLVDSLIKMNERVDEDLLFDDPDCMPFHAQSIDHLEEVLFANDSNLGGDAVSASGGGGATGHVNWCAANVMGCSLHMTLVPPPGSRNTEADKDRHSIIKNLKAKNGNKIIISASKYHIAEISSSSQTGGKQNNKKQHEARKRVGFWEVDSVNGLEEADHYPNQRRCYHITDVGSLGNSTKPFASFEVLNESGGRGSLGKRSKAERDSSSLLSTAAAAAATVVEPIETSHHVPITKRSLEQKGEKDDVSVMTANQDTPFMKRCLELAVKAKEKGNLEIGCLLVNKSHSKIIIEAEHCVHSFGGDETATAECLLVRKICQLLKANDKIQLNNNNNDDDNDDSDRKNQNDKITSLSQNERNECIAYFNQEPDRLGIELLKRGGIRHVVYGTTDLNKKRSNDWQGSKINTEKYLLPIQDDSDIRVDVKRSRPGPSATTTTSSSSLSSTSSSSPSVSNLSNDDVVISEVGQWTVRTFTLNKPLEVEAIITMK